MFVLFCLSIFFCVLWATLPEIKLMMMMMMMINTVSKTFIAFITLQWDLRYFVIVKGVSMLKRISSPVLLETAKFQSCQHYQLRQRLFNTVSKIFHFNSMGALIPCE